MVGLAPITILDHIRVLLAPYFKHFVEPFYLTLPENFNAEEYYSSADIDKLEAQALSDDQYVIKLGDKVREHGIGSLTTEEEAWLDAYEMVDRNQIARVQLELEASQLKVSYTKLYLGAKRDPSLKAAADKAYAAYKEIVDGLLMLREINLARAKEILQSIQRPDIQSAKSASRTLQIELPDNFDSSHHDHNQSTMSKYYRKH